MTWTRLAARHGSLRFNGARRRRYTPGCFFVCRYFLVKRSASRPHNVDARGSPPAQATRGASSWRTGTGQTGRFVRDGQRKLFACWGPAGEHVASRAAQGSVMHKRLEKGVELRFPEPGRLVAHREPGCRSPGSCATPAGRVHFPGYARARSRLMRASSSTSKALLHSPPRRTRRRRSTAHQPRAPQAQAPLPLLTKSAVACAEGGRGVVARALERGRLVGRRRQRGAPRHTSPRTSRWRTAPARTPASALTMDCGQAQARGPLSRDPSNSLGGSSRLSAGAGAPGAYGADAGAAPYRVLVGEKIGRGAYRTCYLGAQVPALCWVGGAGGADAGRGRCWSRGAPRVPRTGAEKRCTCLWR